MEYEQSLKHAAWECKYHFVQMPKCRNKILYGQLRKTVGEVLRGLALQIESVNLEGRLMVNHVHVLISIPQKYSVADVVWFLKGKSATQYCPVIHETEENFGRDFLCPRLLRFDGGQ